MGEEGWALHRWIPVLLSLSLPPSGPTFFFFKIEVVLGRAALAAAVRAAFDDWDLFRFLT